MTALPTLLRASLRMYARSLDTVLFGLLSPLLLLGIFALVQNLRYGVEGGGSVDFFTFSAIGFAAFIAAHFNQDGVVGAAAGYRAQGVLKRLAVTPVPVAAFIAAQVLTRTMVGVAQTVGILAIAVALGAEIRYTANLLWVVPLAAIALLTGVAFAFALAGITRTPEGANQLNIALFTPVFLLAGVMYPLDALPGVLPTIAEYAVPFAAQIEAFRGAVDGQPVTDYARQVGIALGWLALAFVLATRTYRFGERESGLKSVLAALC